MMKIAEKVKSPFEPVVHYNPELDKYEGTIWFPEKLALAKKMLEGVKLPEHINDNKMSNGLKRNEK